MVPGTGADGTGVTERLKVPVAGVQGSPSGLFVVSVILTVFPASPGAGVYVNAKDEVLTLAGEMAPSPLVVIVTLVALPPKVLPLMLTADATHVVPDVLLNTSTGPLTQPQSTANEDPVLVHPAEFRTVI